MKEGNCTAESGNNPPSQPQQAQVGLLLLLLPLLLPSYLLFITFILFRSHNGSHKDNLISSARHTTSKAIMIDNKPASSIS
jgi:hypothetical protein